MSTSPTTLAASGEARYLAGIAAGLRTENNHLGYVAAMQIPECIYSMNAYFLGARSVNPDVTMDVLFTNTWYDPTIEGQAAQSLIDMGCDVIAQHQDTTMPVAAAEEAGIWACGYNCDMTEDGPNAHLTDPHLALGHLRDRAGAGRDRRHLGACQPPRGHERGLGGHLPPDRELR